MKKERLVKGCIAALAAAGLIFSGPRVTEVDAADAIETGRTDCSIKIKVEGNLKFEADDAILGDDPVNQAETDLKGPAEPIEVKLYRTAKITVNGDGKYVYEAVGEFAENDGFVDAMKGLSDETSAEDWRHYAVLAAKTAKIVNVDPEDEDAAEVDLTKEDALGTDIEAALTDGEAEITGLSTGLYLVAAGKTHDENYQREYSFAPYLISLPDNRFDPNDPESTDEWMYGITVGLKPEVTRMLGDLQITKTLSDVNKLEGDEGASCVFHVVVTDTEGSQEKEIYNNMVAFRLKEAGEKDTITIGKFPAGAKATVTEVYAGAGYEAAGDLAKKDIVIISDMAVDKNKDSVATTDFINKSDGTLTGGYGIVNHFTDEAKTVDDVRKESNAGIENKTAYSKAEGPGGTEDGPEDSGNVESGAGTDTLPETE